MFGAANFSPAGVSCYQSAKVYLSAMRPWRGETDTYDERPMLHRRARHLGVRITQEGAIHFRLHSTDVVTYYPDGSIVLSVYASSTTDSFANAVLGDGISTRFLSGYVVVDKLAYRAVDFVSIFPDRTVQTTKKWTKYMVDRRALNAATQEYLPALADASAWLKAANAMGARPTDYSMATDMFSRRHSLAERARLLRDRANWKYLTPETLASLREDFTRMHALVANYPVNGIPLTEINAYRAAWRKWGEPT